MTKSEDYPPIHIFIHAALLSGVDSRLEQYLTAIYDSGLSEVVNAIYICYVGSGEMPSLFSGSLHKLNLCAQLREHTNIVETRVDADLEAYELPTLSALYNHCVDMVDHHIENDALPHPAPHPGREACVLYLHTKNVGKSVNLCIEDQIEYTLHFLVYGWRTCLSRMVSDDDDDSEPKWKTSGVDLRTTPTLHYSGNFWWARADYIASLLDPRVYATFPNMLNSPRHNQEFWICSPNQPHAHYIEHDCGIDVYSRHLVRYPGCMYT